MFEKSRLKKRPSTVILRGNGSLVAGLTSRLSGAGRFHLALFRLSKRLVQNGHRCRHTRGKHDRTRYTVQLDADRNSLCQPYPSEHRVDRGQSLHARCGIGDADSAVQSRYVPHDRMTRIGHEGQAGLVSDLNARQFRLLEITDDPEAVSIDYRHRRL